MTTEQIPGASDTERIVIECLEKRGLQMGVDYDFQSSLIGGRYELGGTIADFTFREQRMVWRVHGDYWHKGVEKEGTDAVQRELLIADGWEAIVDIWGSDLEDPAKRNAVLEKALQGEEVF